MPIGTLAWTQQRGKLSLLERWRLRLQGARQRNMARVARRPSLLNSLGPAVLDDIERPWNALAFAASSAAQALQPPWLLNHGLRSYAWATLLALDDGVAVDRNLLFAACLLHGMGLSSDALPGDTCFTMRSSRLARAVLQRAGANESQQRCVAEAITLHANLEVSAAQGAEAHLLHAGAALDVIGARSQEIPAWLRLAVLHRYPRLGLQGRPSAPA